jgi:endonuclease-3
MANTVKNSGSEKRAVSIFRVLRSHYSNPGKTSALGSISVHNDPFRVLISTVLSQRTRDEITEDVEKQLFAKYPDAESLASASVRKLEKAIRKANFYRTKAKAIKAIAAIIDSEYGGRVPDSLEELMKLPHVGRKTANCVLVYGFRENAIPVDTHVHRVSNRLGLVKTKKVEDTEEQLMNILPARLWLDVNELLVLHGQNICRPLKPLCHSCPISQLCDYADGKRET